MPPTTSAGLLALVGVFDIVGTVASGWLTDRVDSRYLLFAYYFLRGLSLLVVPGCCCTVHPSLFVFIVFYGLDWVATVPPTVALCRQHFGAERAGVVFGWVFAATWSAPASRPFRRVGAAGDRRLLRCVDDGRRPVPGRGRAVPAHPAPPGRPRGVADPHSCDLVQAKSSGFQSRCSTSTIQLPELSRQRASTPYGRSDGSCMNSTPLAEELLEGLAAVVDVDAQAGMPPSSCARLIASTRWSAMRRTGHGEVHLSSGWFGCTTVHQR